MRAVAVVALGGARVAQARNLAVEGVEEGLRFLLVTAAALVHHHQPEVTQVGSADLVRGVAVLTGGKVAAGGRIDSLGPVHALLVLLLDPVVTGAAGRRDVIRVD